MGGAAQLLLDLTVRSDTIISMCHNSRMISALYVNKNSVYKALGLDCWDIERDATRYKGPNPVIAHPPCRLWSKHMRHFSKAPEEEKQLAWHAFDSLMQFGGILEHPYGSLFLDRYWPGEVKIVQINQCWFGYPITKRTWLMMPSWYEYEMPFRLESDFPPGYQKRWFEKNKWKRSETTLELAKWLIETVEKNEAKKIQR